MSKGFILKVLENVQGADMQDQIDAAKDMLQHGYDANEEQWQALNRKVDAQDKSSQTRSQTQSAQPEGGGVVHGTKGHQQYVSGAEPGAEGNQIGWPGTDQDQDGPGKRGHTVPGVKPKHDKK
jgi:hypothetical protein